jgi:hypothetical protein
MKHEPIHTSDEVDRQRLARALLKEYRRVHFQENIPGKEACITGKEQARFSTVQKTWMKS